MKLTHNGGNPKKYLDARLNVQKVFEVFINDCPELTDIVKYSFYLSYFKENLDYSFGRPQVDVCSECERLKVKLKDPALSENAKLNVAAELCVHKRIANKFYTALKEATENQDDDTVAFCFDYMSNLPLPNIPNMRQLWVNTFCIHNMKTNKAKFYTYHEGEANKSPDEVSFFLLLHYLHNEIGLSSSKTKLIVFSDGTSGQNKNHTLLRFLMNLCDQGMFERINNSQFPVRGHSFLPCDRDFGSNKRLLREVDRVYTPDQYNELILKASKVGRFSAHKVQTDEILSFKSWWPKSYKKITVSDFRRNVYESNTKRPEDYPVQDRCSSKSTNCKSISFRQGSSQQKEA